MSTYVNIITLGHMKKTMNNAIIRNIRHTSNAIDMPLKTVSSSPLPTLPKELEEKVATLQLLVLGAMLAVSADEQADFSGVSVEGIFTPTRTRNDTFLHSVRCSPSLPSFLHEHSACSASLVEVLEGRHVLNERCLPGKKVVRAIVASCTHAVRE